LTRTGTAVCKKVVRKPCAKHHSRAQAFDLFFDYASRPETAQIKGKFV